MSVHVPTLLEGILEATAAEAAAKARITTLRAALEDEARRRFTADGAAPSWNAPALGKVRLDPATDWTPAVADHDALAGYVAENYPTEATVAIHVAAEDAADALQALTFISVKPVEAPRVEVRSAWLTKWLADLAVDVTEERDNSAQLIRTVVAQDPNTSAVVPGIGVTRSEAKLVVSLDRDRRTAAITEARTTATALVEASSDPDDTTAVDHAELDRRRVELEGLHADQLAAIAGSHQLGKSGTKAALAERIARAELATGNVIRPAAEFRTDPAQPGPHGNATTVTLAEALTMRDVVAAARPRPADVPTTAGALVNAALADPDVARVVADFATTDLGPGSYQLAGDVEAIVGTPGPLPDGTEVEEVTTLPAHEPEAPIVDQPVEEVPDGGDVADVLEESPEQEAATLTPYDDDRPGMMRVHIAQERALAIEAIGSREVIRQHAKRVGVSAAGTKGELALRLVQAGYTADTLTQERTA